MTDLERVGETDMVRVPAADRVAQALGLRVLLGLLEPHPVAVLLTE